LQIHINIVYVFFGNYFGGFVVGDDDVSEFVFDGAGVPANVHLNICLAGRLHTVCPPPVFIYNNFGLLMESIAHPQNKPEHAPNKIATKI
jgi:hypothetical protein